VPSSKPDRRKFALGATASVAMVGLAPALLAQDASEGWEQTVKKLLGDAKPIEGKVLIDLPEIAENGNTVPFTVSVDSPMSETDNVRTIYIIATANPQPGVATFHFSPLSGKAMVASRMRLARTQDVLVIAELSEGRFLADMIDLPDERLYNSRCIKVTSTHSPNFRPTSRSTPTSANPWLRCIATEAGFSPPITATIW